MSQKCVVPFKIVVRACNQLGDDLFFCNLAALESCLNICSHVLNILHHGEWGRLGFVPTHGHGRPQSRRAIILYCQCVGTVGP